MKPFRVLLILALAVAGVARAQTGDGSEPAERIRDTATRFVAQQSAPSARVEAAPLDSRLRLPACGQALRASSPNPPTRGAWTVSVSCEGAPGNPPLWAIYVPVRVADLRAVVVITRAIPVGQPITADALATEPRDVATLSFGYLDNPAQAVGKTLRRPLSPGSTLTPDALAAQKIISRGALVTILGRVGALEVRAQGKALGDAGGGERVSVENLSSHRIVEGVVRDGGLVEVTL